MKNNIMLLIVVTMMTASLSAQTKIGLDGYAGGGVGLPMKDLEANWKTGHHGSIGFGYSLTPGLEAVARYAYNLFPVSLPEDTAGIIAPADITQDFDVHEFGIDIRANLAATGLRFQPFGLIGAGMARMPAEEKMFYSIGGGIKVALLSQLNLYVEARYTRISVDDFDISYVPVTAGLNLGL